MMSRLAQTSNIKAYDWQPGGKETFKEVSIIKICVICETFTAFKDEENDICERSPKAENVQVGH